VQAPRIGEHRSNTTGGNAITATNRRQCLHHTVPRRSRPDDKVRDHPRSQPKWEQQKPDANRCLSRSRKETRSASVSTPSEAISKQFTADQKKHSDWIPPAYKAIARNTPGCPRETPHHATSTNSDTRSSSVAESSQQTGTGRSKCRDLAKPLSRSRRTIARKTPGDRI